MTALLFIAGVFYLAAGYIAFNIWTRMDWLEERHARADLDAINAEADDICRRVGGC